MSEEQQPPVLEPIEVKEVEFYGDSITAALVKVNNEQQVYVPLRPLCDYLGLAWSGQFERIKRHRVMSKALNSVRVTRTELKGVGQGQRTLIALPLEMLPGWLMGIEASRVKPELQDKVVKYQEECFKVLWQAFQNEVLSVTDNPFDIEPRDYQPSQVLVQIRENALAIARMAEQQMELERQVAHAHERLDNAGRYISNLAQQFDSRIESLEEWRNSQPNYITDRQASEISQRVKDLAAHLASGTPGNHYKQIFDEIYRRFHVASYKQLTREQYGAVLEFLNNWHDDPNTPRQGNLF